MTRAVLPKTSLIRFVLGPQDVVTPDLKCRLPGRGVWVTARRDIVAKAVDKKIIVRNLLRSSACDSKSRADFTKSDGREDGSQDSDTAALPAQIEAMLEKSALSQISLLQKSGDIFRGPDKIMQAVNLGKVGALIFACDASERENNRFIGAKDVRNGRGELEIVTVFSIVQLSMAIGRENIARIGVKNGAGCRALLQKIAAFTNYRTI